MHVGKINDLNLSVIDMLRWIIPGCEVVVLCMVGDLAAPLASTHWMPVAFSAQVVTIKMSPDIPKYPLGAKVSPVEIHWRRVK